MSVVKYVEVGLAKLAFLIKPNPHDQKLFHTRPAFKNHPEPTITVKCPEVGPTMSALKDEHTQHLGNGRFPALTWNKVNNAVEYALAIEDLDSPFSPPGCHGIMYGLPATKTSVIPSDFEITEGNALKGGFKYGKNHRGIVYIAPRPLLNHGLHRYYYCVIALKEPLNSTEMSNIPTRDELAWAMEGKVLGWGSWIGTCERKWE